MTNTGEGKDISNEGKLLADKFASIAADAAFRHHMDNADKKAAEGATEQEIEHTKRGRQVLTQMLSGEIYNPSPNLTIEENLELKSLIQRSTHVDDHGNINAMALDQKDSERYLYLQRKRSGSQS